MASIKRRGNSYRAVVSHYKKGKQEKITKTFVTKQEAELWALNLEIEKANGNELGDRNTPYAIFFRNWIYSVKQYDVRPATFANYVNAHKIIGELFHDIPLGKLNDVNVQAKLDLYGLTHAQKTTKELCTKIKTSLKYAYGKGLLSTDFRELLKPHGIPTEKRNKALTLSEMAILKRYCLKNTDDEFNLLVLLALETGARRGELLGITADFIYQNSIEITQSISPTSDDRRLKNKNSARNISINQNVFDLVKKIQPKENGFIFDFDHFKQSEKLGKLLIKLNLPKTTFHGLRDTHATALYEADLPMDYISLRLGHDDVHTTEQYYIDLGIIKRHSQDANALDFLNSL